MYEIEGKPYLFLEYICGHQQHGSTLSDWLEDTQKNQKLLLSYAIQFCTGMIYAINKTKLVHRDIKPSNIMVARGGIVKITDFGLVGIMQTKPNVYSQSKMEVDTNGTNDDLTQLGSVFGSRPYMSPEQWQGIDKTDERSDIYSFGAVLYAMVCGHPPFVIPQELDGAHEAFREEYIKKSHFESDPAPLSNPVIDPRIFSLIYQCLAKNPDERIQSFTQLKEALLLLHPEPYSNPKPLKSYWEFYLEGLDKLNQGNYIEALPYFENVVRIDKRIFHAYQRMGQCHLALKDYVSAKECLQICLDTCKYYSGAFGDMGYVYHMEEDEDIAIEWYQKALTVSEQAFLVWNNLGLSYSIKNQYSEAISALNKALDIQPSYADALENLAYVFNKLGQTLKAAEYNRNSLILRSGNLGVMHALMMQLMEVGAYSAALQLADVLDARFPGNKATPPVFSAANKMATSGVRDTPFDLHGIDFDSSMEALSNTKVFVSDNHEEADYELINIISWMEIKAYDKALDLAQNRLMRTPNEPHIMALLGMVYYHLKDFEKSKSHSSDAVEIDPEELIGWRTLTVINLETNRLDQALSAVNQALRIGEQSGIDRTQTVMSSDYNNQGNIFHKLQRYDKAIKAYEKSLQVNLRNYLALENMAICYKDMERPDDGIPLVEKAMGIQRRSATGWYVYGDLLNKKGLYERAVQAYGVAIELDGSNSVFWNNLGRTLSHLEQWHEAKACFDKAIAINPEYTTAKDNLKIVELKI